MMTPIMDCANNEVLEEYECRRNRRPVELFSKVGRRVSLVLSSLSFTNRNRCDSGGGGGVSLLTVPTDMKRQSESEEESTGDISSDAPVSENSAPICALKHNHSSRRHHQRQSSIYFDGIDKSLYQTFQINMTDIRKSTTKQPGSLFTNFEDVRLTDEERIYLNAAATSDTGVVRQSLEEADEACFNLNCTDYMGRNALHLAVDSENIECIEILMDKLNFACIEEALLHAISKGLTKVVRIVIEHPNYMAGEDKIKRMDFNNAFFRMEEKSQFSPDITPLILAAHNNNHEVIQMFLSRKHTIDKPHTIDCMCRDCTVKQNYDSLKRSRSRLNAYRALASPAYMALSCPDPIMTTFELRQEMMKLAEVEKEFKREYLMLVEQCMNFACEMMDLCRGTLEVEAVISDVSVDAKRSTSVRDPLGRLKMAIRYEEKKFVAHANCQQYLTSIWYGAETNFLQSWSLVKKVSLSLLATPLLPIFCIMYILFPQTKFSKMLRCPASKFATHTISHFLFLLLLAAATFRIDEKTTSVSSVEEIISRRLNQSNNCQISSYSSAIEFSNVVEAILKQNLRPANTIITYVQMLIVVWIGGLLLAEIKTVYVTGLNEYFYSAHNVINNITLILYIASYTLRFFVDQWVKDADNNFNATNLAREAIYKCNVSIYHSLHMKINSTNIQNTHRYFMEPSRFKWKHDDPEIISDVLFALANVISFARTTYLMPAFEVLGPLQISFNRMLGDITRFMVLFLLVLFAFMVGLHNLYWYYGNQRVPRPNNQPGDQSATEPFENMRHTIYSLFWSMFGMTQIGSLPIRVPGREDKKYSDGMIDLDSPTQVVESIGNALFAIYHVIIIIVLVNMLIAMMSHTFEAIQEDCDVEWKFARTKLWLNYIDNGGTLPVPFNLVPTPFSFVEMGRFVKNFVTGKDTFMTTKPSSTAFVKVRRDMVTERLNLDNAEQNYADIMIRLVKRYLFKLERNNDSNDGEKAKDPLQQGINVRSDECVTGMSDNYKSLTDDHTTSKSVQFADEADEESPSRNHLSTGSSLQLPGENINLPPGLTLSRRANQRRQQVTMNRITRRQSIIQEAAAASTPRHQPVQFLAMPQLDAIQRTQKILDMRLQTLQAQSDQLNYASGNARIKEEIEHIRLLIGENQKALLSIVKAVSLIQETSHMLNNNMQQWVVNQTKSLALPAVITTEEKVRSPTLHSNSKNK